jgi:L-amino acid N-acyltransferase YncA
VTLNKGQAASLSWLEEKDLLELVKVLNSVVREKTYLLMDQEITDLNSEREWFQKSREAGRRILVAKVDSKLVGAASMSVLKGKQAHVAQFAIYIAKSFRNRGLGTILINELIDVARKSGVETIQISAFSTNKRAIHVYQKCGFKKCGKLSRDVRFTDGTYADRIIMELLLA